MLELVFVLAGIIILVKGKVVVREGCELHGRKARFLGLLYLGILPSDLAVVLIDPSLTLAGCVTYAAMAALVTLGVVLCAQEPQTVTA